MEKLLPIGTIVLMKDASKRLMIIGIKQQNSADGKVYDYIGCLYPEGYIDKATLFLFNQVDVERVDFIGFVDAEFQAFRSRLAQKAEEST